MAKTNTNNTTPRVLEDLTQAQQEVTMTNETTQNVSEYGPEVPVVKVQVPTKVALYEVTESQTKWLTQFGNKSKAIRGLKALGYANGAIAKELNIRPQHVYNVLHQIVKNG